MDLDKILATIGQIGADLPAYKALFDQAVTLFNETDQAKLKQTYAAAMAASDRAHADAQSL